jgi:hypothetical protein
VPTDSSGLPAILDDAECRRLLMTATIGHLGFTDGALPVIVPVPFALHGQHVVIPTHRSSPMVTAVRGAVVAFEVDSYDPGTETGWSVTVIGPSHVVGDLDEVMRSAAIGLPPQWTRPDRSFIFVELGLLRGWRAASRSTEPTAEDAIAAEGAAPG